MTCPTCTIPTRVIDSRADDGDGNVRRRRYRCWKCGTRFSTYEISAAEWEKVQAMRINTEKIDATIATLRMIKARFSDNGNNRA